MAVRDKMTMGVAAFVFGTLVLGMSTPVRAGNAGAFIGGVFATKLLDNVERRTAAEEAQATAAQQPRYYSASPAPAQKSAEQRLAELDKLAAGGYITPEEYKRKKQQILDSM
jgi:hypothetical protein